MTPARAVTLLLVAGAGLRVWQYAGNPALWMDELALGHNIITRPLGELLSGPLEDGQIAPPGYLVVVRVAVVSLGSSEYALRLFPFLCALAGLPLFGRIALRVLRPRGALLATALFAFSAGVILFAGEGKQYATDLLVALAVTELALRWLATRTTARLLALAGAGVVSVWFSQPAVFVTIGVGLALLLVTGGGDRRRAVLTLGLWAVAGGLSVLLARSRLTPGLVGYMTYFWRAALMPWPLRSRDDVLWPARVLQDLFGQLLEYPWPALYLAVASVGAVSLVRRRRDAGWVLLLPILVTLAAAMVRAYPFGLRLVLFLVPAALLLVGEGVDRLGAWFRVPLLGNLSAAALAVPPLVALVVNPPVWRLDDARPVLAELQRRRRPGDVVFAYYPAWQTLRFYGPRYGLLLESVDLGPCHPDDLHDYLEDLDRYRGRQRVWVFSSFNVPRLGEARAMTEYLDTIGIRREVIEAPANNRPGTGGGPNTWRTWRPTSATLYDLSDPARLAAASAASRDLPPAVRHGNLPRCVQGPLIPHVPTVSPSSPTAGQH